MSTLPLPSTATQIGVSVNFFAFLVRACTMKMYVPLFLAVPEMTPVDVSSFIPSGSLDNVACESPFRVLDGLLASFQMYGAFPPLALNVIL